MTFKLFYLANVLLATASPATGDTRNVKLPVILGIVAVVLIILCIVLTKKPGNKDKK